MDNSLEYTNVISLRRDIKKNLLRRQIVFLASLYFARLACLRKAQTTKLVSSAAAAAGTSERHVLRFPRSEGGERGLGSPTSADVKEK